MQGKDTREGDSPSWFNPNEAVLVVQYLQAVLKSCLLLQGKDTREGDSPSWFNPNEAVLVVQYLQAVLKSELVSSRRDDIGIITPYRKQVTNACKKKKGPYSLTFLSLRLRLKLGL